jgi:hypothetical protein
MTKRGSPLASDHWSLITDYWLRKPVRTARASADNRVAGGSTPPACTNQSMTPKKPAPPRCGVGTGFRKKACPRESGGHAPTMAGDRHAVETQTGAAGRRRRSQDRTRSVASLDRPGIGLLTRAQEVRALPGLPIQSSVISNQRSERGRSHSDHWLLITDYRFGPVTVAAERTGLLIPWRKPVGGSNPPWSSKFSNQSSVISMRPNRAH